MMNKDKFRKVEEDIVAWNAESSGASDSHSTFHVLDNLQRWDCTEIYYTAKLARAAAVIARTYTLHVQWGQSYNMCALELMEGWGSTGNLTATHTCVNSWVPSHASSCGTT